MYVDVGGADRMLSTDRKGKGEASTLRMQYCTNAAPGLPGPEREEKAESISFDDVVNLGRTCKGLIFPSTLIQTI
jgi:hypothetical protein